MGNRAWWMELNYRGQRSLGKITPSTCPTCPIMERSAEWLRLTNAVYQPPPHPTHSPPFCIITKITIMKILSASQPPSPRFFSRLSTLPPTAWLTPAGGNSSKWNWGCNSLVLLKYICPSQTMRVVPQKTKGAPWIIWSDIFFVCVMFLTFCVCLHKYDFSHEILVDYSLLYHNTDLGKLHPDFFFFF